MSSPVSGVTQQQTSTDPVSTTQLTGGVDPLANEETFLKLLVSQLQNQDPMNPTDSNQFVSQLTSYSQLEQLIGIHKNTTNLADALAPSGSETSSGANTNGNTNSSGTTPTTNNGN